MKVAQQPPLEKALVGRFRQDGWSRSKKTSSQTKVGGIWD